MRLKTTDLQQVRLGPTEREIVVPEHATIALFGVGLLALGLMARRRKST